MSVQCYIPRDAADAINIETMRLRARERGVESATFEYSYHRTSGRCLITCQPSVAAVLVDELARALVAARDGAAREDCERALAVVRAAIAES